MKRLVYVGQYRSGVRIHGVGETAEVLGISRTRVYRLLATRR